MERSLPHLGIAGVSGVRVGRRVELTVEAADEAAARAVVDRLAGELLSNPLMEQFEVEPLARAAAAGGGRVSVRSASSSSRAPTGTSTRSTPCAWRAPSRRSCGTSTADIAGVAGILLPGGFAYGDYLRAGVIARFTR